MKKRGVMIAAVKSGSGKTVITSSLLAALKQRGKEPIAWKTGPDYIDPMFHRAVLGISSGNLDAYFTESDMLTALYQEKEGGISIVEGVMGLFDGLGGTSEEASSYALAETLELPVILVVDAYGMGRTLLPVLSGMLQYDASHLIKGVILNKVSAGYYPMIAPLIEKELSLPVLGYVPKDRLFTVGSRHLGLQVPAETDTIKKQLWEAGKKIAETVSIEKLLEIAESGAAENKKELPVFPPIQKVCDNVRIAIARDEAFCFIYEENLNLLRKAGAELVFFSPLHDRSLPENISGLILYGGYPELYAEQLSENVPMLRAIKKAVADKMPCLAECGGFLYLHEKLLDEQGNAYPMCGVIPGEAEYRGRSPHFGYIRLSEKHAAFLPAGTYIKGHEFHYYESTAEGDCCKAEKPQGGKSWETCHVTDSQWIGFPHLYYPSNPDFVYHFLEEAVRYGTFT